MKKENEEIIVGEICKKYFKREKFIILLIKICRDNNIRNIKQIIEENI